MENVNPFDMFFQRCYGMSFIPNIRDMTQQAIGILRGGHFEEAKVNAKPQEIVPSKQLSFLKKLHLAGLLTMCRSATVLWVSDF